MGPWKMAVKAIKAGAFDFLQKPFSVEVLSATIESARRVKSLHNENVELRRTVKGQFGLGNLVSSSEVMKEVFRLIECVADSDSHSPHPRRKWNRKRIDCSDNAFS